MNRGRGMLRHGLHAWAGVALLVISGCLGGTGTDTENGITITTRVVDGSGAPVAGLEMQVSHTRASADSVSESPLLNPGQLLTTDDSGMVSFHLKNPGIYIAMGRRGDSVIVLDTLRALVDPGTGVLYPELGDPVYLAGTPVRASGHLKLLSGFRADSGRVYLRGTSLLSNIGADGAYDLRFVPPAAERMVLTVIYAAKPAEKRFVKIAVQGSGLSVLSAGAGGRCLSDSTAAASPVDTVNGSLSSPAHVARLVGKACVGREGALVRALRTDAAGNVLGVLGGYIIPAASAPARADSSAVSASCVSPARIHSDRATLRLVAGDMAGEIIVDDLVRGVGCLE